jgi:cytochrome b561
MGRRQRLPARLAAPAWRVTHRPPALPTSMPKLMQLAAHAGHLLLYGLMIAIPLSGWLMSSAKGFQTVWFGVLPIPDLLARTRNSATCCKPSHMSLNLLFVAVIAGHIGAALKHHFIDKDDILTRMLPAHNTEK